MSALSELEYLTLECKTCRDKIKLAKNKGNHWVDYSDTTFLTDFLLEHWNCDFDDIVLDFMR